MNVPDWWELALLGTAAWRTFQLLSFDDLLDSPRRRFLRLGSWQKEGDVLPVNYRRKIGEFMDCPYCFGFWVALGWWGAWQIWPHATLVIASIFALSTAVIALAKILSE